MRKMLSLTVLTVLVLAFSATFVFAAEEAGASAGKAGYYAMLVLACGLAIGLGAFGTGIGQGIGLSKACEGVARNPGASGKITTTLIIGLAMIESLAIYALVVVLILLFANPIKF